MWKWVNRPYKDDNNKKKNLKKTDVENKNNSMLKKTLSFIEFL